MIIDVSKEQKEKIADLIAHMLHLCIGLRVDPADDLLVDLYLKYISRIDKDNPMKELLLLDKSFAERLIHFKPVPHSFLAIYDDIMADEEFESEK